MYRTASSRGFKERISAQHGRFVSMLPLLLLPLLGDAQLRQCDASFRAIAPKELHALTILFHEPLLDRTGTLKYAVPTAVLDPIPPFNATFNAMLDELMLATKCRELCWSWNAYMQWVMRPHGRG